MVTAGEKSHETYALLDDGSTKTIISERLADILQLDTTTKSTTVHTVNGMSQGEMQMADFQVTNLEGDIKLRIAQALVTNSLTAGEDQPPKNQDTFQNEHLSLKASAHDYCNTPFKK